MLVLSILWAAPAVATTFPQSACSSSAGCLLKEGTPVSLKFANDLSSGVAGQGDPVEFVLDDDLEVEGSIVVAKGARAVGIVSSAKKAQLMKKPGELSIRLQYLIAGSDRVRIRATEERAGDTKTWREQDGESHRSPISLVKRGKNVEKPAGTQLTAYVDQDIWLAPIR